MLPFAVLAGVLAVAFLGYYLGGHLLVTRFGGTTPAPDGVADRLPFESPPVLLLDGDRDARAAGAGPPGFRRLLVREDLLDDDRLAGIAAVHVGGFETYAFDVAVLSHLLRLELLAGLAWFLLRSARVDRPPAVAGAAVLGVLVALYALHRVVLWRVGLADEWAAERVGTDAVAAVLEAGADDGSHRLLDLLRARPRAAQRLARLE